MKGDRVRDFGRIREVREAARKVAFRIRGVSDVPFRPELLSVADRASLRRYLVEVREWTDRLLRELGRDSATCDPPSTRIPIHFNY